MLEEETKDRTSMIEEVEEIIIGTTTMMIEQQEIGDRVHHHHPGKTVSINLIGIKVWFIRKNICRN